MKTPEIIHTTPELIAVNKPAGWLMHAGSEQKHGTLIDWVIAQYPEVRRVGEPAHQQYVSVAGEPRGVPGVVHRLDKETSGVVVIARTRESYRWLKKCFAERRVEKHYTALVYNTPDERDGVIEKPIVDAKRGRRKTIEPNARAELKEKARSARTRYRVSRTYADGAYSLLDVMPETGRTHQIRVHMAAIGHHVVCDKIYAERRSCPEGGKRLFLHATSLVIPLPHEQAPLSLHAPLPAELERVLVSLDTAG